MSSNNSGHTEKHGLLYRTRNQIAMLIVQFLLGMAVNLMGDPKDLTSNFAKTADKVLLGLHGLVAIGLIVGAIMINRLARGAGPKTIRIAGGGGLAIGVAVIAGIATTSAPHGDLWSYLMSAAFIAAFVMYGWLYVQTKTAQPTHN